MPACRLLVLALLCFAAAWSAGPGARAATVTVEGTTETGHAVVRFSGVIGEGDARKLLAATSTLRSAVLVLDSKGGSVGEGLRLGTIIRARSFVTYVPAKATCASMCGVLWLSGRERLLDSDSRVGFHAAFDRRDKEVSGTANAIIGAYLQAIGVNPDLIAYVTTAGPTAMTWMTVEKATRMGVAFSIAMKEQTQPASRSPAPAELVPVVAVANATRLSCDLDMATRISETLRKDRDTRDTFLKENRGFMLQRCHEVADRSQVVVQSFHKEAPLACIRRPAGADCEWMQLGDITVRPDLPVPTPPQAAPPAPPPPADPRARYTAQLQRLSETQLCSVLIGGNKAVPDEPFELVTAEAVRRRVAVDRCAALVTCADPAATSRAKALSSLACDTALGPVNATEVCRAALTPDALTWRDVPAFFFVRNETRQRGLDLAACRRLLGPDPPAGPLAATPEGPSATLQNALEGLDGPARERVTAAYLGMARNKALARRGTFTWRHAGQDTAADAERTALEACQISRALPCWLVAINDTVMPDDRLGEANARSMPRVLYAGPFDPTEIPILSPTRRAFVDITGYAAGRGAKASAIHPRGIFVVATGAASAFEAERLALDQCAAMVSAVPPAERCWLYSSGDTVVLPQAARQPLAPAPE